MSTPPKAPRGPRQTKTPKKAALEAEVLPPESSSHAIEAEVVDPAEIEPTDADLATADEPGEETKKLSPSSSRALTPLRRTGAHDPLQRYLSEAGRYPLLTREEEHALATKFRETGDVTAAYKLVASNLRLVVKIAFEYHRTAFSVLDLIQEGNIGLMHAVQKFDPTRGVKLSTYAAWWIRAFILRFVMDNWRMVKLGTTQTQRKLFFNLKREKEKLLSEGFDPGPRMLAERLDVTEQDVIDMDQRMGQNELSLDAPVGDDSSQSHQDRLTNNAAPADERLASNEIKETFHTHLNAFAATLTDERERYIFERRLIAEEPLHLQEIGDHFGITRERSRQIEAKLTGRLKLYMKQHLPDFDELSFERQD